MAARQTRTPSSSTLVIEENPNGSGTGRSRIVPEIRPGRRGISRGGREVDGVQGGLFPYKLREQKKGPEPVRPPLQMRLRLLRTAARCARTRTAPRSRTPDPRR